MGGEPVYRSIESGADNLGWILRSIILSDDRDCGNSVDRWTYRGVAPGISIKLTSVAIGPFPGSIFGAGVF